jgi:NIMA (never in mitosis gene a)-related kinase 1/4/5
MFEKIKRIGSGTFGAVWLVERDSDGKRFALKTIPHDSRLENEDGEQPSEITVLNQLDSEYILKLHESYLEKDQLCLVMDYCENGDLQA